MLKCITETIQVSEGNEYIREPHVGQSCSKQVNMQEDLSTMKKNLSIVQENNILVYTDETTFASTGMDVIADNGECLKKLKDFQ